MAVVQVAIHTDQFGRLTCDLCDDETAAVVTASDTKCALEGISTALDRVRANGIAECYWNESVGQYRWVLRQVDGILRVAVMWSTGAVTGWEHVFWTECDPDDFDRQIREGLARVTV